MFMIKCESGEIMSTFKDRFLLLKTEKNVTLTEIAESIGSNQSTLSRVLTGKYQLKQDMIEGLSSYFDVDQAYLLGESSIRKSTNKLPDVYVEVIKKAVDKKVSAKKLEQFIELWSNKEE